MPTIIPMAMRSRDGKSGRGDSEAGHHWHREEQPAQHPPRWADIVDAEAGLRRRAKLMEADHQVDGGKVDYRLAQLPQFESGTGSR